MLATRNVLSTVLEINPSDQLEELESWIRTAVYTELRRKGVVVGLSGGIDSSVTAALCARAWTHDA